MIYSRMLHTEHDCPNLYDGGAHTIFCTPQANDMNNTMLDMMCLQRFAVLWNWSINPSIIHLVEQAIFSEKLSPVLMLHEYLGILIVVYNHHLQGETLDTFQKVWTELVLQAMPMVETIVFLAPECVAVGLDGGEVFRKHALNVLTSNELGIVPFTPEMRLV